MSGKMSEILEMFDRDDPRWVTALIDSLEATDPGSSLRWATVLGAYYSSRSNIDLIKNREFLFYNILRHLEYNFTIKNAGEKARRLWSHPRRDRVLSLASRLYSAADRLNSGDLPGYRQQVFLCISYWNSLRNLKNFMREHILVMADNSMLEVYGGQEITEITDSEYERSDLFQTSLNSSGGDTDLLHRLLEMSFGPLDAERTLAFERSLDLWRRGDIYWAKPIVEDLSKSGKSGYEFAYAVRVASVVASRADVDSVDSASLLLIAEEAIRLSKDGDSLYKIECMLDNVWFQNKFNYYTVAISYILASVCYSLENNEFDCLKFLSLAVYYLVDNKYDLDLIDENIAYYCIL